MMEGLFLRTIKKISILLLTFILFWQSAPALSYAVESPVTKGIVNLRILETTDLHTSLMNYDYYHSKVDNHIGLVKTATLIKQARKEAPNTLLFDDGDHIKGNPLGEFLARIRGIHKGKTHPVYRAFNYLKYDAITLGNHELNYGLHFINEALKGVKMPVVNANVYFAKKNKPYFKPYVILKRNVVDESGENHLLKIGVIGFMPPQIMKWDKANLEGKVIAKPIVDTAKEYIPIMKREGADIIVALAHTGISGAPYHPDTENAVYYLSQIPEIDAILSGHAHNIFPSPHFAKVPNTNIETGEMNGKPVVMAGAFGNRLGIIDLKLVHKGGKWVVIKSIAFTRSIVDEKGNPLVKIDNQLYKLIKKEHEETVNFIKKLGL
jgi:2',3'-cyclic-nucleotide 2'-phosphodiesterase